MSLRLVASKEYRGVYSTDLEKIPPPLLKNFPKICYRKEKKQPGEGFLRKSSKDPPPAGVGGGGERISRRIYTLKEYKLRL